MEMSIRFPNIRLYIYDVGRSINIGGLEITYFGILTGIALLVGLLFIMLEAKRRKVNVNQALGMIIIGFLGGAIGGRLFYAAFSWDLFKDDLTQLLNLRTGGMAILGVILGGIIFIWLYCKLVRAPFGKLMDLAAPAMALGQAIGCWGFYFNREGFGEYTDTFFAMQLPLSDVRTEDLTYAIQDNLVNVRGTQFIQVHPTFFYESMLCLLLFLILWATFRRKSFDGEVAFRYLAGYSLIKLFIDILRTDALLIPGTEYPVAIAVTVPLFLFSIISIIVRSTVSKKRKALRKKGVEEYKKAEEERDRRLAEEGLLDIELEEETEEDYYSDKNAKSAKPPYYNAVPENDSKAEKEEKAESPQAESDQDSAKESDTEEPDTEEPDTEESASEENSSDTILDASEIVDESPEKDRLTTSDSPEISEKTQAEEADPAPESDKIKEISDQNGLQASTMEKTTEEILNVKIDENGIPKI